MIIHPNPIKANCLRLYMRDRVLWFVFGDVTYWSFAVGEEECLAGTLWSGANAEASLQNFEAWLELFLDINKPDMIGMGLDASIEPERRARCEACYDITRLQAGKHDIRTFNVDLDGGMAATPKQIAQIGKRFGSPN